MDHGLFYMQHLSHNILIFHRIPLARGSPLDPACRTSRSWIQGIWWWFHWFPIGERSLAVLAVHVPYPLETNSLRWKIHYFSWLNPLFRLGQFFIFGQFYCCLPWFLGELLVNCDPSEAPAAPPRNGRPRNQRRNGNLTWSLIHHFSTITSSPPTWIHLVMANIGPIGDSIEI